ncbi:MAG: CpsB/CapC family capsule biosynthesis tyrosine phosphatase [Clostridiaceae bacterium]
MNLDKLAIMDVHNHTNWSDGINTPEQIIENAILNNVKVIGITDHYETQKCGSVSRDMLPKYIEMLDSLKEKYKSKIKVVSGIEICMNPLLTDLDNLPYSDLNKLDFVLFEYVNHNETCVSFDDLKTYASNITCKKGLAHTDLMYYSKSYGVKYIIDFMKNNSLFWELNVNSGYDYFYDLSYSISSFKTKSFLKKFKKNNIAISVGSDIHSLISYDPDNLRLGNFFANHIYFQMYKYDFSLSKSLRHVENGMI